MEAAVACSGMAQSEPEDKPIPKVAISLTLSEANIAAARKFAKTQRFNISVSQVIDAILSEHFGKATELDAKKRRG